LTTGNPAIAGNPRRWDTTVDGIMWVPRMIDKARMREAGELGLYMCGHSPIDKEVLNILRVTTDEFASIVARCSDDDAVLAALRARGFDEPALRGWCARFQKRWGWWLIPYWERDEGYVKPTGWHAPVLGLFRKIERPIWAAYKMTRRAP